MSTCFDVKSRKKRKSRKAGEPQVFICWLEDCGLPFFGKSNSQNKFCSYVCYWIYKKGRTNDLSGKHDRHIKIKINGKDVWEHRHIFEQQVRALEPGEIVHHKNENKQQNTPENLEALAGRAAHLHKHNYWRDRRNGSQEPAETTPENEWLDTAF